MFNLLKISYINFLLYLLIMHMRVLIHMNILNQCHCSSIHYYLVASTPSSYSTYALTATSRCEFLS